MIYVFLVGKQNILDKSVEALACECSVNFNLLGKLQDYGHYCALYSCEDQALENLREINLEEKYDLDIFALKAIPNLNKPGIVVLDMDMTSVQIEGIDEIARSLGVFDKVAAITSKAMHGGLDFATSLKERVSMLKDGSAEVISKVKEIMVETSGLDNLMAVTAANKWARGICSGGFVQLIEVLEQKYKLEMVCANSLEIVEGKFTGKVDRDIVDAEAKRLGVLSLMSQYNIDKSQVIVLGDGANDLKMLSEASLGIAYHAKPKVKAQAQYALNKSDLNAVVLLLKIAAKTIYA
ncbi:MAG: phosphoserine phosphatase SerB [Succinatimonas sp.]|nr:phosphoserine phosphatase SerB [Succinatimonas sp.]